MSWASTPAATDEPGAGGREIVAQAGSCWTSPPERGASGSRRRCFQHVRALRADGGADGAGGRPRRRGGGQREPPAVEGSYMPVFTAGASLAESVAAAMRVPLVRTTHQQGHLRAGWWAALYGKTSSPSTFRAVPRGPEVGEALQVECHGRHGGHQSGPAGRPGGPSRWGSGFRPARPRGARGAGRGARRLPVSVSGMKCSLSGARGALMRRIQAAHVRRRGRRGLLAARQDFSRLISQAAPDGLIRCAAGGRRRVVGASEGACSGAASPAERGHPITLGEAGALGRQRRGRRADRLRPLEGGMRVSATIIAERASPSRSVRS